MNKKFFFCVGATVLILGGAYELVRKSAEGQILGQLPSIHDKVRAGAQQLKDLGFLNEDETARAIAMGDQELASTCLTPGNLVLSAAKGREPIEKCVEDVYRGALFDELNFVERGLVRAAELARTVKLFGAGAER